MDQWSLFFVALGVGMVLLVAAALADRAARAKARAALASPPRDVPGFDGPAPDYIPADDVLGRPIALTTLDADHAARLQDALDRAQTIPAGWASDRFATHSAPVRAVLFDPLVLVTDEIGPVRELLVLLQRARQLGHPLVLVTGEIDPATLDTLVANRVRLDLGLLVVRADEKAREDVLAALGTQASSQTDRQAGWLPPEALGTSAAWVSDARTSRFAAANPQPSRQG